MLELYQEEDCDHCVAVRRKLTELGASYVAHTPRLRRSAGGDVCNRQTYDELLALSDEDEIPFLVDHQHGETRSGSEAILDYLEERYD